ncbi:CbtA family protein [Tritonibacter mobilis]|uniref:Cobalt transporter n=1 Tax=Tritonibacter mobilis F1926 TaxID=1265309 RepID=A0A1B0ZZI1_9RHOB|nr:CbtA family protein [Tritonibacter mobilis]ANP39676.1 cobalt transporter [Tritonibacter mobilis F1926]KJZ23864.1 cobalt transporter [Tritonibacter mobilis]
MFGRILTSALFAGAAAGLIAALLQLFFVQPVLLHAELYESGELVHFGGEAVSAHPDLPGLFDEPMRNLLSILFTMLTYTGYALVMVALMSQAERQGHEITARHGIIWGLAGFVTFHFAPGLTLAPEVPGVAAADVGARQVWWVATVASAGVAMWLIAFGGNLVAYVIAALLLVAPHVIGAPEPDSFTGPVPTEIGALFAARAFGIGMAAWVLLGAFCAYFWQSETAHAEATA